MTAALHAFWFPFLILSFLFKSLETNSGMFGRAEALVEKYPVFFYCRVANKFYSQRQNIRCTQQGGSAQLRKKKVGLFCSLLSLHFTVLPHSRLKRVLLSSNSPQMNLIPKLHTYSSSYINEFLNFQT